MATRLVGACMIGGALLIAPFASAQIPAQASPPAPGAPAYTAPRTPFGHPSVEGVWATSFIMPMEASPRTPQLVVSEQEAKFIADRLANEIAESFDKQLDPEVPVNIKTTKGLPIVRGERRTRAIVLPADGMLPYTPEARKETRTGEPSKYDNIEERPYWERCITNLGLPPVTFVRDTNQRIIVQTPTHVVLHTEYGGETRLVPFADKHRPKELHTVMGDSIARWEGDTLVIETVSLPEKDRKRAFANNLIVSGESKVIEKLTRVSETELLYQFTVEDPKVYTAPWLAEYSMYMTDTPTYEHACHEGNYSVPNILRGARMGELQAQKKQP